MFVRNVVAFVLVVLLFNACSIKRHVVGSNVVSKGLVSLCADSLTKYRYHISIDSANSINLRIYSMAGIRLASIKISQSTADVVYAITDDLKNNIQFYLDRYKSDVCINEIVQSLFFENVKSTSLNACYSVNKIEKLNATVVYDYYNLQGEKLFSFTSDNISNLMNSKPLKGRLFIQNYCLYFSNN